MPQTIEHEDATLVLGYWAIRGLAQPIRFLLTYAEAAFTEVRYGLNDDGTTPDDPRADWLDNKAGIGLPFPNLPYLIDTGAAGEIRATQSNSVMRYLARCFDLYGNDETDRVTIDVIQDEAYDFRNEIVRTAYTPEREYRDALVQFTSTTVPRYLDGFEAYLDKRDTSSHFVGERISLVDFILYELIWQTAVMVPGSTSTNNRPRLFAFIESFERIPQIAAYMKRDTYIERPINGHSAYFR